jgi:hypothetical protein
VGRWRRRSSRRWCSAARSDVVRLEASSRPGQKRGGAVQLQQSREARVRGAGDCGTDRGRGAVVAGANTTSTACAREGTSRGRFYSEATLLPPRRSKGQVYTAVRRQASVCALAQGTDRRTDRWSRACARSTTQGTTRGAAGSSRSHGARATWGRRCLGRRACADAEAAARARAWRKRVGLATFDRVSLKKFE